MIVSFNECDDCIILKRNLFCLLVCVIDILYHSWQFWRSTVSVDVFTDDFWQQKSLLFHINNNKPTNLEKYSTYTAHPSDTNPSGKECQIVWKLIRESKKHICSKKLLLFLCIVYSMGGGALPCSNISVVHAKMMHTHTWQEWNI